MENSSKTLLRVPELLEAVKPLVSTPIDHNDIFRLIGTGDIRPHGFIQRIPVFEVSQIGEIARQIEAKGKVDAR